MNKLLLFFGAALTLSWAMYNINYRPYISTRMAQVLMSTDIPDNNVIKLCDGSGWITHGDGHKTLCPGCSACEGNEPDPVVAECECGCDKEKCNCQSSGICSHDDNSQKNAIVENKEIMYLIYHFGTKRCLPCERMKNETWNNDDVKSVMNKLGGELYLWDANDAEHKKFFDWYEVTLYPTIIIMPIDDLEHPIFRVSGYVGPEDMKNTLKEKLKDE
tara:strand:- start:120 stop:770 length:651 start_codon:yes stop_codon:yes gene_type:complete